MTFGCTCQMTIGSNSENANKEQKHKKLQSLSESKAGFPKPGMGQAC